MKVNLTVFAVLALIISVNTFTLNSAVPRKNEPSILDGIFDNIQLPVHVSGTQNGTSDGRIACYAQYAKDIYQAGVVGAAKIRFCDKSPHIENCIQKELAEITVQMNLGSDKLSICLTEAALSNIVPSSQANKPLLTLPVFNVTLKAISGDQIACYVQYAQDTFQIAVLGAAMIRFCDKTPEVGSCIQNELSQITALMNVASDTLSICTTEASVPELKAPKPRPVIFDRILKFAKLILFCRNHTGYDLKVCNKVTCMERFVRETYHIGVAGSAKMHDCLWNALQPFSQSFSLEFCIKNELLKMSYKINIASMKLAVCLTHADVPSAQPWPPSRKTSTSPTYTTPTIPSLNTTQPEYSTNSPTSNTTWPQSNSTSPDWNTTASSENSTWSQWNTTAPSENSTWPQWSTTAPSGNSTWPQWNTTASSENSTWSQWNTTAPSENSTWPQWSTTAPSGNLTWPQWNTTASSENSTWPQWNTTTPSGNSAWPEWNTTSSSNTTENPTTTDPWFEKMWNHIKNIF